MIRLKLTLYFRNWTCYKEGKISRDNSLLHSVHKCTEILCLIILSLPPQYQMCLPSRRETLAEMLEPEVILTATIFSAKNYSQINDTQIHGCD